MDLEQASASIDALIDKRAAARTGATFEEMLWKESVRKHNANIRRQHGAEWYCYFSHLTASLRACPDRYERRAEALTEEKERTGKS